MKVSSKFIILLSFYFVTLLSGSVLGTLSVVVEYLYIFMIAYYKSIIRRIEYFLILFINIVYTFYVADLWLLSFKIPSLLFIAIQVALFLCVVLTWMIWIFVCGILMKYVLRVKLPEGAVR